MFSCGLYDGSGAWACTVGLPAKSGVSGLMLVVVPNVLGLAVLSPPLNEAGNSVRGMALVQQIAETYNLNLFEQIMMAEHNDVVANLERMRRGKEGGACRRPEASR